MAVEPKAPAADMFLETLEPEQAQRLRSQGMIRHFPTGTALFYEGQQSDKVFVLLRGRVKLSCVTEEGKEVVVAIRGPGDLLGELSALDGEPRSASGTALDEIEALVIPPGEFASFLAEHPQVALSTAKILSRRLRDADRKRVEFAVQDSVGRLASRLVELLERFGESSDDGVRIDLPISQEELAGWAGCSREAIAKAFHTMRDLGWLETGRRSVLVKDPDALKRRST